ncbi:alginate lyase family protein [Algoriphagus sp.]|uniref:alginate lyase family protein n=1 Tax=Algoriphagus sp. TaxID=1872435 RepID=UPI0025F17106|nr:alginate lyase family protein [Algoriphagus sp.]
MGFRYVFYRISHEFEKRSGLLKSRHPQNPPLKYFISWEEWRENQKGFFFDQREDFSSHEQPNTELKDRFEKIKKGIFRFFFHQELDLGLNYNWVTHPLTGKVFSNQKHWSEVPDFDPALGDIKYLWEKSRFTFIHDVIRYDLSSGEDHSLWVKNEIESWITSNPINSGPNWRCSQEISLRIFNWSFALNFYRNSPHFNEEFWIKVQHVVYWSLHHVYQHIDFSRIAVRNNHAISETLFLTVSELLFPFIPETKKWADQGRRWFEEEIDYQIYEDGTFLQFSTNYQRVVVQLLTFGITLTEIHQKPFSVSVYKKAYDCLNFLFTCQVKENGFLPNYGANDGALFFQLSEQHFRDYRPQLNSLHKILTGKFLYEKAATSEWDWFGKKLSKCKAELPTLSWKNGAFSFPFGGYYIIREIESLTFIRCGSHIDRPQQADNLHIDIWINGKNVLLDSGTYKYNCEKELKENFEGTVGHNTVSIEKKSQMLKGSRFIWFYWTQCLKAAIFEKEEYWEFEGKISAFRFLFGNCIHNRNVIKKKGVNHWRVKDTILNVPKNTEAYQIWNSENLDELQIQTDFRDFSKYEKGYFSEHYGEYKEVNRLYIPFKTPEIETSFFYKFK